MAERHPAEHELFEAYEQVDEAEPFDAEALTRFEVGVWGDGPGQPEGRAAASVRERLYEMNLPFNDPASVKGREIPLDPPANDRLAELRCPVLMIAGTLDFSDTVDERRASRRRCARRPRRSSGTTSPT